MSAYEQEFLQNITNIRGVDFETWQGWEQLMAWTKRQPWKTSFLVVRRYRRNCCIQQLWWLS